MKSFLILNTLIILIVFSFSCGDQGESGPKFGTGTLKQAVYNLNKATSILILGQLEELIDLLIYLYCYGHLLNIDGFLELWKRIKWNIV